MKKLLLVLVTLLFVFTLSACGEDVPTLEDFNTLETSVLANADDIAALETDLAAIETSLATNVSGLAAVVTDVDAAELDLVALETSLDAVIVDLNAAEATLLAAVVDITAIETELETFIDAMEIIITNLEAELLLVDGDITAIEAAIVAIEASIVAIEDYLFPVNPLLMGNDKTTEIVIAHTNDVHGRVNDDSWSGTYGMATIKNLIDALKDQHDNVFLVDAGDIFHGTTYATLEEGASVVEVMNQVGYDLMVPGNHDFDYGQDRLLELEEMANFPMITSNVQYAVDDTDFMNPYYIAEFDGVTVGFFGITSPETAYKTHPDNVIGLNFLDPIAQATLMVAELEGMVDIIILLAHVGLDDDTLITTEDIALAVPGIDVIIDGHSHSTLPDGMMVGTTLIVSTGEYMKNLGTFTLNVVNGEIVSYDVELFGTGTEENGITDIDSLGYGYDWEIQMFIDDIVADQAVILNEVVGQTAVELMGERDDVRTGETNLGNLITDAMIIATGADVAITNGGGIRASIPAGDVTVGDIITVLPFGNIIVTIDLTGQELLDSLEYGVSSYPSASGKMPHIAGMTFEIDYAAAAGSRVINLMIDGVAVDLLATYSVATNDFLAAGGDGYEIFAEKTRTGEFNGLHEALTDLFTIGVDIAMPVMGRIVVVNDPNVAAANAAADNAALVTIGVVTAVLGDGTFTMEDRDGAAIYADDYNDTIDWAVDAIVAVGDLVKVTGLKSTYNELSLIDTVSAVEVLASGYAITDAIVVDDMAIFRDNITVDDYAKRYIFTDIVILETGYYSYFFEPIDGFDRMGIVGDYSVDTLVMVAGETVTFTAVFYGTNGNLSDDTKIMRFSVTILEDYVVTIPAP